MIKEVLYLKCPSCGESNYKQLNETTCQCNIYGCKTKFFIVDSDISSELNEALHARERYNFKQADEIYINILSKTQDEKVKVSCYFGRLLSYFGVIYVKDFNGNSVITFSNYDSEYESIKESTYYNQIINSSYSYLYIDKLEELDKEYKKIKKELEKDTLYDIFICVKISNKTILNPTLEGYTVDSNYARDIYDELTKKGLKVFYSEKSLSGIDYDAQIYSALMRSKSILVITSKKEYLESPWVQSEWRRWINFIKEDVKERNSLYLFIPNDVHIELPNNFRKIQKFTDTLKLVSKIENNLMVDINDKSNNELEDLLISANNLLLFQEYKEAEELYKSLCKKYINDYRPWLGLVDILIEEKTEISDKRYNLYIDKSLSLCKNELDKKKINDKYNKYLNANTDKIININNELSDYQQDNTLIKTDDDLLNDAINNYKNKNYNLAFNIFYELAKKGNAVALNYLGDMYCDGNGVAQDYNESFKWFEKSANLGYAEAQKNLAWMYDCGYGVKQNLTEAFKWYEKAANQGNARAQCNLANMHCDGKGTEKNYDQAFMWYEKSAKQGLSDAQYMLSLLYEVGKGVKQNQKEAFKWCEKAANQEDAAAQLRLAIMYHEGKGVEEDFDQALIWYEKAANQGHVDAQYEFACVLNENYGVEEAYEWYEKAANQGHAMAQYELANIYNENFDYDEAFKWYEKAANQRNSKAQYSLANMYYEGNGVEKNYEEAFKWYEKSANLGLPDAQYALGRMYYLGTFVNRNYEEAFKWYTKAAGKIIDFSDSIGELVDIGHELALCDLGKMYFNGEGVEQNNENAFKCFQRAAKKGNVEAQYMLSIMYEEGLGTAKDFKEALKWFEESLKQNYSKAINESKKRIKKLKR